MMASCWPSELLLSWMLFKTTLHAIPLSGSNHQLRSVVDKGSLPWICCSPPPRLLVPKKSSVKRSGLGRWPWTSMGLLASDQVQQPGVNHMACALCRWLKIPVCTTSTSTLILPTHIFFQTQQYPAASSSQKLVVQPHQPMVLLMGLFVPSQMSTKGGGGHSSPVTASPSTSLPLW